MEYQLNTPIEYNKATVGSLTFKKPTLGDMRQISLTPTFGDMFDLAMKLSGQTTPFMDKLESDDAMNIVGIMGEFLAGAGS